MSAVRHYFGGIFRVLWTCAIGMRVTLRYFLKPETVVTFQYPRERDPDGIPPRHRGIHFLETEKCILCYVCAKACPVSCIDIEGHRKIDREGFKARGVAGAADYAQQGKGALITRFTIDYSKCLFCNLCCEPCPEDCIHMGPEWNFAATTRGDMLKSLLAGQRYTQDEHAFTLRAQAELTKLDAELEAEKERKKQGTAAVAAAAKKAAEGKP